jgi:nickel-dependent lactate racemase
MVGHHVPPLGEEALRQAFAQPVGCAPIRELARGKKRVVILFDDLSRPTRIAGIAPYVIEELAAAGVGQECIQFLCAQGSHGSLTEADFARKLGPYIVEGFNVFNHNPYECCEYVGTTRRGTPVHLSAEYLKADLKIGIGSIVPHPMAGFGGGAKIVLPGVASMETIEHNHLVVPRAAREEGIETGWGMAQTAGNALLLDMQDACRMSGLDVKIDAIVNADRETVALFVGEPACEYDAGVEFARSHYLSPLPDDVDVVVTGANAKANEPGIALGAARSILGSGQGTVVLVWDNPLGSVQHYLYGRFGNNTGGRAWGPGRPAAGFRRLIVQTATPARAGLESLAPFDTLEVVRTWTEAVSLLEPEHPNGARVAVVPDGTIQYFRPVPQEA